MKTLKQLGLCIALTMAISLSTIAGEVNSPPCASPDPGEVNSPPCSVAQSLPTDSETSDQLNASTAESVSISEVALNLLQSLLTIL
jgi:hypothetical protein